MLSLVHVEIRVNLFTKLPTLDELFWNVGLVNVAEQVSRLPVSNAQGYMLNLPTQKVACDERREKLRPNLMFAMFFG